MASIAVLAAALLPFLVLATALVGSSARWIVARVTRRPMGPAPADWFDALARLLEDIALGFAAIAGAYLVATLANVAISPAVDLGILAVAAALFVVRFVRDRSALGFPWTGARAPTGGLAWVLAGIIVAVVGVRLATYAPFLVYAGNDIRLFSLLTQLVEAHGHFVTSWGPYAAPSWNVVVDSHLRFGGSEAGFAFLNAGIPWGTPQLVSAATIDIGILLPFSAFVLFRRAFPSRGDLVAVAGAGALGLLSAYPLFYQTWGGIDEQLNWLLVPVALAFFLSYLRSADPWDAQLWLSGIVFGGALIVNPFPLAYVGIFLVALVLGALVRRAERVRTVVRGAAFYAIGVLIASPILYAQFGYVATSGRVLPSGSQGLGSFQTYPILVAGHWVESFSNFFVLHTGIAATILVVVLGWVGLCLSVRRERFGIGFLGFAVGLVLLNSNGPDGLYFVAYPGWNGLFPDRPLEWLFLPLSAGAGLAIDRLAAAGAWTLHGAPAVPPSLRRPRPSPRALRTLATVGLVVVLVLGGAAAVEVAEDDRVTVAWGSSLTSQDLAAFDWMESHLPAGSTTLVMASDAGTWIPEFTGLRVFPYPELITNASTYDDSQNLSALFSSTHYGPTLAFLAQYNISAAYWGQRTAYSLLPAIAPATWLDSQPVLAFVTDHATCEPPTTNASLLLSCDGDSATFLGPVVLELSETQNGTTVGTGEVALATGVRWTFTLASGTGAFPGNWTAEFSELPLGSLGFADGNVRVATLAPGWMSLETPSSNVTITVTSGTLPQR